MALGDIIYRGSSVWKRLVGNTTTTKKFLRQTGTGSASAAPAWDTIASTDLSDVVAGTAVVPLLATVVLTDAQNKNLPSGPFTLAAAPGSGYILEPVWARAVMRSAGGAYTNINAAAWLTIEHATSPYPLMSSLANDAAITTGSATRVSALFGAAATNRVVLVPAQDSEGLNSWGPMSGVWPHVAGENKALQLTFDNGGSGNLTGGNAANTLTVTVLYMKVPI